MPTTRKPAVRSAAASVKPGVPARSSAKLAAKPAGKRAATKVAKRSPGAPAQAAAKKAAKPAKADKAKKAKLVRDSFTMPKSDYALLDTLKSRAASSGRSVKKSELVRAGIKALAALSDPAFVAALAAVPPKATGPASD